MESIGLGLGRGKYSDIIYFPCDFIIIDASVILIPYIICYIGILDSTRVSFEFIEGLHDIIYKSWQDPFLAQQK